MTSERDFDRLARAWLELGPDEAPDRVIAAVLQAADTMPQVRRRVAWPTWRPFQMNRLLLFAGAAVLLVALIGGGALIGGRANVAVSVTPSPTAVPSPSRSAAPAPVPTALQSTWVGAPRSIPGLMASARYRFELKLNTFRFPFDDFGQGQLLASASTEDGDVLRLTSTDTTGGCQVGDVGTYRWSLSSSGNRLTLTVVNDAWSRALLRRHGPGQERPEHDDDELRRAGAHRRPLGALRLLAGLRRRRRRRPPRRPVRVLRPQELLDRGRRQARATTASIPAMAFVAFQAVFAIITVALISGAIADRAKFGAWMVFAGLWATLVYFPVAHWVFAFDGVAGTDRRLDRQQPRRDRLRRRHRGAHQRRCRRPRRWPWCSASGVGFGKGPDAPAQPAARDARRRPAVVRLVRLQRRLRARRRRHGRRRSGSTPWSPPAPPPLGWLLRREAPRRPRHLARRRLRRRRRPGRDHPGLRRRRPRRRDRRSASSPASSARSPSA